MSPPARARRPPAAAPRTDRIGRALRSTRSGARDATTTATAREAAARPAPGKAEALGNNLARTAAATRAARGVRAVAVNLGLALRAGPVRTPARDAIRTLAVRASATLPKKEAGEAFRHAREKLSGPGAASGAGGALPGPAAAAAGAKGLSAGAIEGSREPAAGLALPAPSLPGTPFPIGEPGGLPGIPAGGPPAQAPAGALAIFPPVPAPAGSSSVAALAGGSEAGLPNAVAAAWPSPAPQRAARAAGATGALSCTAAGAGEPVSEPCAAARSRLTRHGAGVLLDANADGIPARGPSLDSDASGARLDSLPLSMLAGSGSGTTSGASATSAAVAPGFALTTLLTLAALLSLGGPRIMRRLSLASERWLASPLALIPERPG